MTSFYAWVLFLRLASSLGLMAGRHEEWWHMWICASMEHTHHASTSFRWLKAAAQNVLCSRSCQDEFFETCGNAQPWHCLVASDLVSDFWRACTSANAASVSCTLFVVPWLWHTKCPKVIKACLTRASIVQDSSQQIYALEIDSASAPLHMSADIP